ncbi:hypothetical protein OPU71_12465 [Niveibacterium sp. 24ML]|uniref:hypothetical protein n=1 Tax=Niveibacterium sp. 24ML TaxID=2985512 RepID=UPI00226E5236|nr:hypothetical protein [Niveibacterium sp. 24ML]MCX9156939.1 hypothetical protein [Niveibacterium sp. 24ML]
MIKTTIGVLLAATAVCSTPAQATLRAYYSMSATAGNDVKTASQEQDTNYGMTNSVSDAYDVVHDKGVNRYRALATVSVRSDYGSLSFVQTAGSTANFSKLYSPTPMFYPVSSVYTEAQFDDVVRVVAPGYSGDVSMTFRFKADGNINTLSPSLTNVSSGAMWDYQIAFNVARPNLFYAGQEMPSCPGAVSCPMNDWFYNPYGDARYLGDGYYEMKVQLPANQNTDFFVRGRAYSNGAYDTKTFVNSQFAWGGIVGWSTLDGTPLTSFSLASGSGTDYTQDFSISTPVDEPPVAALMLCGLLLGALKVRRELARRES